MLDLMICEFAKIKRQRFILFSMLAACLFPIPITVLAAKDHLMFDELFNLAVFFGHFLLLPCILSAVAAILFFAERDNDTLKNLMTVPVSKAKLALAKLFLLLVVAILYSIAGLGATIIGGLIVGGVKGVVYKLGLSIVLGTMTFVSALPAIILIVHFNKSYIFSILLAFFYAIFNFFIAFKLMDFPTNNMLITALPVPVIMRWWAAVGLAERTAENAALIKPYLLSTPACVSFLLVIALISIPLIIFTYKKQEN